MRVTGVNNDISFKGSIVKILYKHDFLKNVKVGIYGERLTKFNVTDEHNIPKCKFKNRKDADVLANISLASKICNNNRGCEPLYEWTTKDNVLNFYHQFLNVRVPQFGFNGNDYMKKAIKWLDNLRKFRNY